MNVFLKLVRDKKNIINILYSSNNTKLMVTITKIL